MDIAGLNLANNPEVMEALQMRLQDLVGSSSQYLSSLPKKVIRRINYLKRLQHEHVKYEAELQDEITKLEIKFAEKFNPLYEKRRLVIMGEYEPTDEEAKPIDDGEGEDEEDGKIEEITEEKEVEGAAAGESSTDGDKKKEDGEKEEEEESNENGVPSFWFSALMNCPYTEEMIEQHDHPILDSLTNITWEYNEDASSGFKLHFHFSPNEYFENEVLTKTYNQDATVDEDELMYVGPDFESAEGTEIKWKEGKNVTVEKVTKKQRKKGGSGAGKTRTVVKLKKVDSFFNFFSPPVITEDNEDDMELNELIANDYEIGQVIKEKVIPHAVMWFTGEALQYEQDLMDEGEEEGGDEYDDQDDEDDSDNDPDFKPPAGGEAQKPAECKQS